MINAVFITEFLVKSISLGFLGEENTYLTDTWNILDFSIVTFSIVDMALTNANLSFIKVIRMIRIL